MAKGTSLKDWEKQFKEASQLTVELQEKINVLEHLILLIKDDMLRFEEQYTVITDEASQEVIAALMGFAKQTLKEQFIIAEELTEGDINPFMLEHLLAVIDSKLIPDLEYVGEERIQSNLKLSCNTYLGSVGDWFTLVDSARVAISSTPEGRMIGWRQIFDAGVLGFAYTGRNQTKLTSSYQKIMAARYALLNDTAPYWYFMEHGNEEFAGDVLYPHPSYGAPHAVSIADGLVEQEARTQLSYVGKTIHYVLDGWKERADLLDEIKELIDELYKLLGEGDLKELVRKIKGFVTRKVKRQISVYQGKEKLESLSKKDIQEVRDKVIADISNGDEFKGRIYHPTLKSGFRTVRIKGQTDKYLKNIGLGDIGIGNVGIGNIGI